MNRNAGFIKEIIEPPNKTVPALWFVFREDRVLVDFIEDDKCSIPRVINLQDWFCDRFS
jgi:hypothetical protein